MAKNLAGKGVGRGDCSARGALGTSDWQPNMPRATWMDTNMLNERMNGLWKAGSFSMHAAISVA